MKKILVLAVHPDDETLGCGGTLLKYKALGNQIHWIIATEVAVMDGFSKEKVNERNKEIELVSKAYDFDSVNRLGIPTMKADKFDIGIIINKISTLIKKIKPEIIFLPFKSDIHSDHKIFFNAAYSCTKSFRFPYVKKVYMMETISETDFAPSTKEDFFVPNTFIDISKFLDKKVEIMKIYKSEVGEHPFPRSEKNIKALAVNRGAMSNCEYAESFVLLKEIID